MTRASIVIPVHNKASLTLRCLAKLTESPECGSAEIIVVDDGSTDITESVLQSFPRVRVVKNEQNLGFATACNLGVEAASHELLILLNNDVDPTPGWLDALTAYAEDHPEAALVGAKLLFANNTVQHAGVVIGQDHNPYHLYSGFPADHPAVNRSRRFQVVTGACMLARRSLFLAHGGFDPAFRNGHEDVDLCLRLGQIGHEVHYCSSSILYHLESASRDSHSAAARANGQLYRRRWAGQVVPDDLRYYIEDGLLRISYTGGYPLELEADPMLATMKTSGGSAALERLLRERTTEVSELLRESVRLTVQLGEAALGGAGALPLRPETDAASSGSPARSSGAGHPELLEQDRKVEAALWRLQKALEARTGMPLSSRWLEYRAEVERLRDLVCRLTPAGARIAVVSRGDDRLTDLPGRRGEHLPQDDRGRFAGFHPADGRAAIESLEALRSRGAEYLALPPTSRWWLDYYPELAAHLDEVGERLVDRTSEVLIYALGPKAAVEAAGWKASA